MTQIVEDADKDGWFNSYTISHGDGMTCGNMICDSCGKKITKRHWYLIKDRLNFKLRGNEHDERFLFHRECSPVNAIWEKHDLKMKSEKKLLLQKKAATEKLKLQIDSSGLTKEELQKLIEAK